MSEPAWLSVARAELGVKEAAGAADNPRIQMYLKSGSGDPALYNQDETPWCAGFVNWCLRYSTNDTLKGTGSLMAKSFLGYGRDVSDNPPVGAIAVFDRPPNPDSGHVAFLLGFDANRNPVVLGGNQSDAVTVQTYTRSQLRALRWPNSVPLPGEVLAEQGSRSPASPPVQPPRREPPPMPPSGGAGGFVIMLLIIAAVVSVVATKGEILKDLLALFKKVL